MHYKNGREAKVGDQVVGTGYNLKGPVVGVVVGLVPVQDSCNIRVWVPRRIDQPIAAVLAYYKEAYGQPSESYGQLAIEYGATKGFLHAEDALKAFENLNSKPAEAKTTLQTEV